MSEELSKNEYKEKNPTIEDSFETCSACGKKDEEVYAVGAVLQKTDKTPEFLCIPCGDKSGMGWCEGCDTWSDNFTNRERCFHCYERDCDAAMDYYQRDYQDEV
jgi:hypothetical protein